MIFGDPNRFAILIEYIPEWGDGYKNGLFHFCVKGSIYPDKTKVATLGGDVFCLSDGNALTSPVNDINLFLMDKGKAFYTMLETMLPERVKSKEKIHDDFITSYRYQASTYNLENDCCFFFAISNGNNIRVVGSKLSILKEGANGLHWVDVSEPYIVDVILDKDEMNRIIKSAIDYYASI
ncbi:MULTISPECIES: immunity 42 family protein [unclassified Symbiopectobacterium]|uniref:immunity 42 family protein n=1 Tax=unclassified Symbiopectobacterium TaxID=2794573 RepID=UPI002227351E|nr:MULTISPECIES: immunity 42 family protein [unclassified Symbiopectobacterium]MCW2474018.1 immunity 42 family protein [Candidatus Symbiopectobacterium sp. NZEC151]MCW2483150.1 immunity 42 family protein [Candidatus Symbiopectobacterium sp. NZEC135]